MTSKPNGDPRVIAPGDQFVHRRYLTVRVITRVTRTTVQHVSTAEWDAGKRKKSAPAIPLRVLNESVRFWL
jgi:hypothetical protein